MDFEKRLQQVNDEILKEAASSRPELPEQSEEQVMANPTVDMYQDARNARRTASKASYATGSMPKVALHAKAVLDRLSKAHTKAKDDSDILKKRGDLTRAQYVEQQYIEDEFLPAIESLIDFNSVDEVLNNTKVLKEFDKLSNLGNTSGSGYTTAYIKSMHGNERGGFSGTSDGMVRDTIKRIKGLVGNDNIRAAVGLANKMKKKIDGGENIASQDDYELIQNIVLRTK